MAKRRIAKKLKNRVKRKVEKFTKLAGQGKISVADAKAYLGTRLSKDIESLSNKQLQQIDNHIKAMGEVVVQNGRLHSKKFLKNKKDWEMLHRRKYRDFEDFGDEQKSKVLQFENKKEMKNHYNANKEMNKRNYIRQAMTIGIPLDICETLSSMETDEFYSFIDWSGGLLDFNRLFSHYQKKDYKRGRKLEYASEHEESAIASLIADFRRLLSIWYSK